MLNSASPFATSRYRRDAGSVNRVLQDTTLIEEEQKNASE